MNAIPPFAVIRNANGIKPVWDKKRKFWRNVGRANRVIAFIENLTVPSGIGQGNLIRLREWQKKFICDVYEPMNEQGLRLVRDAVLSMGRKNGKTTLIAALVLVHLVGPEAVQNGEVYSAANDKEQAAIVFKFAAQFVRAAPELDSEQGGLCRVIDSTKRITCAANGSFYRALSRDSKTKHGLNPTFVIYDELSQALDRELYDVLNTAFGARDEPLFAIISTQSRDPQHILSELIDRGLAGYDDSVVCHLYAVPEENDDGSEVDIWDESLWKLANPALGDFLTLEAVRKLARQAKDNPSFEPAFRNLTLNQRVDITPCVINMNDWRKCKDDGSGLIEGEGIYLGLDLSATTDLTALVGVSADDGNRLDAWFWKPEAFVRLHQKRDRAPYERWVKEGFLLTAPGKNIDYELVALKILDLSKRFKILGIAFDRWRMDVLIKCFEGLGIPVYIDNDDDDSGDGIRFVKWGQGYKDMAPSIDALDSAVNGDTLRHSGHPVLTFCFSNAVATSDPAGNRKLDKSKARFRIDGAVAGVMALGLKARDAQNEQDNLDDFLGGVLSG